MAEAVSGLTAQAASVPVYSTVTGALATEEDFDAVYWGRNIRQTVRFAAAVHAMLDAGINTFVELSPHPVLSSMVLQCAATIAAKCANYCHRFDKVSRNSSRCSSPWPASSRRELRSIGREFIRKAAGSFRCRFTRGRESGSGWILAPQCCPTPSSSKPRFRPPGFTRLTGRKNREPTTRPSGAVTRRLPSPEALGAGVKPRLAGLEEETHLVHSVEARNDIEKLAVHFAIASLIRLGLEYSPFQRFTAAALREQLGVQTRHARLLTRMLEMLVEEGLLNQSGEQFETALAFQTARAFTRFARRSGRIVAPEAQGFCD